MKFSQAIVSLAGIAGAASAAKSYADLGNGAFTIPIVNGTLDFDAAVRHDLEMSLPAASEEGVAADLASRGQPGTCDPQFPTRKTICRVRTVSRNDYLRAYAKFIDWINTGPDAGWIPKHSCKAIVFGEAAVTACSQGGKNPTCQAELVEAMRELDSYCSPTAGGDIKIRKWLKRYSRHSVRDAEIDHPALYAVDDEEQEEQEQHPHDN
ncbi:uncharacterized protein GGS25DRAFT_527123 [Hypoxylon fragiforme]|uniref:uncharacterized protein n=1 Tax=Hypoxylon fragiforme TaxID=63214 RepID=UPI0020C6265F|nr:uncharacterized protein GGS25DRAFT_527123 [Hypoxylon fragiforme]KAI2614011.1 hypothetical protein GGS25DRAFT_527123 [Hypoxylon fragiforme]